MDRPRTEAEFERQAQLTLERLVDAISDLERDEIDADLESGVLTVAFETGPKIVINSHRAALQIWMASGPNAWHFDLNGTHWLSEKTGAELWANVERELSARIGVEIALR